MIVYRLRIRAEFHTKGTAGLERGFLKCSKNLSLDIIQ
jgi:hypothetical protein